MAISTYSQLQSAVADWVERSDLTARIPDFIALAESRINRRLNRPGAEVDLSLTGVPGSRFIALPADFNTITHMWIVLSTGREGLTPATPASAETSTSPGRPSFWWVDGANIAFERPVDQAYSFQARELAMLKLSDAAPTNDILTWWPDVYLYGALAEAAPYMLDDERMQVFDGKFEKALAEVSANEHRNRATTTLRVDLPAMSRRRRLFNINAGF